MTTEAAKSQYAETVEKLRRTLELMSEKCYKTSDRLKFSEKRMEIVNYYNSQLLDLLREAATHLTHAPGDEHLDLLNRINRVIK